MNTRTAAGISMSTLPRSRTAGLRVEPIDLEAAAERIDDLSVLRRSSDDATAERSDERYGDRWNLVAHGRGDDLAACDVRPVPRQRHPRRILALPGQRF